MGRLPLWLGVLGALVALVIFFPAQGCGSTDEGFPPEGPDPNDATCSTLVFSEPGWGSLEGGNPATDHETSTADLLWRQMALRALGIAAIPFGMGLVVQLVRTAQRRRAGSGTSP